VINKTVILNAKDNLALAPASVTHAPSSTYKSLVAIIDQVLVSGVNFFTGLLLARYMSPVQYGVFVLIYSVFLFVNVLQSSLITQPMLVLVSPLEGIKVKQHITSTYMIQILLTTFILSLILIGGVLTRYWFGKILFGEIIAFLLAILTFQGQEFFRQVLFTRFEYWKALLTDLASYGLQLGGIIALYKLGILTIKNTFGVMGITSAVAMIYGISLCRKYLTQDIKYWKVVLRENWNFGKWILSQALTRYFSGQLFVFAIALIIGVGGTARFQASCVIFGPVNILIRGSSNYLIPWFSKKFSQESKSPFSRNLFMTFMLWVFIFGILCLIIALLAPHLLTIFYKDKYIEEVWTVRILAVAFFISASAQYVEFGARAMRRPDLGFWSHIVGLAITVALIWPLLVNFDVRGAAFNAVIVNAFVFAIETVLLLHGLRKVNKCV